MDDPAARQEHNETVKRYWTESHQDAAGGAHDNYQNHPLVQAYISLRALGGLVSHVDAAIHAVRGRTSPGDTILSLGCGAAHKERQLAAALPDRRFIGTDIVDTVLDRARAEAAAEGLTNLTLTAADFNRLDLEPDSLQVVLGLGAVHHVENLEGLWEQARRALRPGGAVLCQEYIGPDRFQWTDTQIGACDAALAALVPDEHKVHHTHVERVPLETITTLDPSEAVRSSEILPTCRAAGFTIEAYASAGGALLQPVLMYQVHTFDPRNWEHNRVLANLFAEEDRLMQEGVLADDFAMFVALPPA